MDNRTAQMRKCILPVGASILSGVFLFLAFPPVGDERIAWFAIMPILLVARYNRPSASFRYGFLSGCIFWLLSISWLLMLSKTGTVLPMAILGWILLSVYSALYIGLFLGVTSWLFGLLMPYPDGDDRVGLLCELKSIMIIFLLPIVWVGLEYVRSVLFGGFPWNALGVSQYQNLSVIQIAEWGGVYAVSALIMIMNSALTLTGLRLVDVHKRRRTSRVMRAGLMIGLLICALCWMYGVRRVHALRLEHVDSDEIRIAAVQPNTLQLKKWDEQFEYDIYERLDRQTRLAAINSPDLIIWPETAVMRPINDDEITYNFVKTLTGLGSPLLVGSLESDSVIDVTGIGDTSTIWYNSSFLIGVDGDIRQTYRKQHLVPFGEYVPLENRIKTIKRIVPVGFSCTAGDESTIFDIMLKREGGAAKVSFGVLICFEDAFGYLARRIVRNGAEFIVNQTNDAWFDGTSAALQHMSHCVFRCIENRVPAVRSSNTGITCFIDSTGYVNYLSGSASKYGQNIEGFKVFGLVPHNKVMTFYTKYGDILFAVPCAAVSVMMLFFMAYIKIRKKKERNA